MPKNNLLLLILSLLLAVSAVGQAVYGSITGTLTDPAGAVVPGAHVAIHDVDRGVDYDTVANSSGNFTQTHLLPGHYSIRVTAPGFAEYTATAVIQVDFITRVDVQMRIGGSSQTVNVTGEAPLLKTDHADVSNTLTGRELGKLPILDRNVTTLLVALPGAGLYSSASMSAAENQESDQQVPVNGQLRYSNGFLPDGKENHSNSL